MWRLVRVIALAATVVLLALTGVGAWAGYLQLTGNFHVVEPGMAYRSNTLSHTQLVDVLRQNGIRTILNLRGTATGQSWYDGEAAAARQQGITLIDIPMRDDQHPDPELLGALVDALRNAKRPLLIHCKAGADRTGLASALFELLVMEKPAREAASQLSFAYGHFPWLGSRTRAMDDAFWALAHDQPTGDVGQSQ